MGGAHRTPTPDSDRSMVAAAIIFTTAAALMGTVLGWLTWLLIR